MRNKKIITVMAGFTALTVAGSSFAVFAAENKPTTEYSYVTGKANGTQYAAENLANDEGLTLTPTTVTEVQTDYSYNTGRQNAQSRNSIYKNLPEGGTKEDAVTFYEQNDIGGGAWVDGAYDESAKVNYGYIAGQQRGSSYATEAGSTEDIDKSGYSYSVGRQFFEENHENWRK